MKKIKERPDEIRGVIKAGIKANRYIRENRDGTLPVMVEWLKIDREMATATYDSSLKSFSDDLSLPENGLRLLIEEAKRAAKVEREVAMNEVADLSILRESRSADRARGCSEITACPRARKRCHRIVRVCSLSVRAELDRSTNKTFSHSRYNRRVK